MSGDDFHSMGRAARTINELRNEIIRAGIGSDALLADSRAVESQLNRQLELANARATAADPTPTTSP